MTTCNTTIAGLFVGISTYLTFSAVQLCDTDVCVNNSVVFVVLNSSLFLLFMAYLQWVSS